MPLDFGPAPGGSLANIMGSLNGPGPDPWRSFGGMLLPALQQHGILSGAPNASVPMANPQGLLAGLNPMAGGQMAPVNVTAQAPQSPILARIFGGADPSYGGMLANPQQGRYGQQGLLDAGLALLSASRAQHPMEFAPSVGQALAQGIQAGREGYQGAAQQGIQRAVFQSQLQALNATDEQGNPVPMNERLQRLGALAAIMGNAPSAQAFFEQARGTQGEWQRVEDAQSGQTYLVNNRTAQRIPISGAEGQAFNGVPVPLRDTYVSQSNAARSMLTPYVNAQQSYAGVQTAYSQAGSGTRTPSPAAWDALVNQVRGLVGVPGTVAAQQGGIVNQLVNSVGFGQATAQNVRELKAVADRLHQANLGVRGQLLSSFRSTWHDTRGNLTSKELLPGFESVFASGLPGQTGTRQSAAPAPATPGRRLTLLQPNEQ